MRGGASGMPSASEAIPIGSSPRNNDLSHDSVDDFSHSLELFTTEEIRHVENEVSTAANSAKPQESFPLSKLPGESVEHSSNIGSCQVYLTNFRFVIIDHEQTAIATVPLLSVEAVDLLNFQPYGIQITCKDGRIIKLCCTNDVQVELHKRLQKTACTLQTNDCFAWTFAKAVNDSGLNKLDWLIPDALGGDQEHSAEEEFERLKFNHDHWRVSLANAEYKLCATYPRGLIVPREITDEELTTACTARNNSRFPTAVWRCDERDTVLLRSSQPCCGIFNYRYPLDEKLLECARKATNGGESASRLLIVDCRSYTAVLANRVVKGGGVENEEYYQSDIEFMGLANIHGIRDSFIRMRNLLAGPRDRNSFLQLLQSTLWLQNLMNLIEAAQKCVRALTEEGRTVLVHCTDGWDRTTQIVTLVKIIADPYYRTIQGFKTLIQRDWIDFGHKFAERAGTRSNSLSSEVSPVFLQWLDCVQQLHRRCPDAFQFTLSFLTKLAQHYHSGLFGTFIFNSQNERLHWKHEIPENEQPCDPLSVWSFLNDKRSEFVNVLYDPVNESKRRRRLTLAPLNIEDFVVWKNVYTGSPIERRFCTDQTYVKTHQVDPDRVSLNRSHSAESLSNLDSLANQPNTSFAISSPSQYPSNGATRSSISSENDIENIQPQGRSEVRARTAVLKRQLDPDGLTNVIEMLDVRTRNKFNELEARVQTLERRIREIEVQPRVSTSDASAVEAERRSFGEASSASCSVESVLSGISMIDKDDASEFSDGSKGWLLDSASQHCMACHQTFYLSNRKHHCRNCGRIFCGRCTSQSYHRVHDNKGENVRVCTECYISMCAMPTSSSAVTSSQSHGTARDTPTFVIGTTDGQTVYG